MNSIFFTVITLLLLTAGVLLLMQEFNKTKVSKDVSEPPQPELMSKEEGEDHFSVLMNAVTPVWYWRVNHEYIDFLHATIKRMKMAEINETPGLFDAQRRCSDLNSAVYKYYDNIKKRCLNGEKVSYSDLDVLNLRQCFREFSLGSLPGTGRAGLAGVCASGCRSQRGIVEIYSALVSFADRIFMERFFENAMYASRWLLAPVYFGLSLGAGRPDD